MEKWERMHLLHADKGIATCRRLFDFLMFFFILFREGGKERGGERGRERETKGERNINVREKHQLVVSCTLLDQKSATRPGTKPAA